MKKLERIAIIFSMVLFAGGMLALPVSAGNFPDVPRDHWAYKAVSFLAEKGFVTGYPDGTFQGNQVLTRYEFAMVVSRLLDEFSQKEQSGEQAPSIDEQGVMDLLLREFQPELDKLRDLIDINTARIKLVETTTDQLSTKVNDLTKQIKGLGGSTFNPSGDLRVRFEGIYPSSGLQTQRPRYRLRWGFAQSINPELTFGARLASGSTGAITSTNQNIDDSFGIDTINIDRAYLQYSPESVPGFVFWAGKFAPPWKNTPLVWDSDTMVEGIAQQYTKGDFQLTLGELVPVKKGYYLVAQGGMNKLGVEGLSGFITYHWINEDAWEVVSKNMKLDKKDPDYLKSNWNFKRLDNPTEYQAIEGYLQYKTKVGKTPLAFTVNYLQNLASSAEPEEGEEALSGWQKAAWAEMAVNNSPSDIGQWQLKAEWGKAQANSVLTWLADADRGGSDWEWWAASFTYRWLKNTDLAVTYFSKDRISKDASEQLIHVDASTKF